MRQLLPSVLPVLLLAATPAPAASAQGGQRVNARQLLVIVEQAFEQTQEAAEAGGLDPRDRQLRPFWRAMDRAGRAVERVGTALRGRDPAFYSTLAQGSTALGELQILAMRTADRPPEVEAKLRLLLRSFRLLRASYGAEHRRAERGGPLTSEESEDFAYLQLLHSELAQRLEPLRQRSAERGDRATATELERLQTESLTIAAAEPGVEAYLTSRIASDEMAGEWKGDRTYAAPQDAALWESARQTVEQLETDPAVGHVFALELGDLSDWSHLEATTFFADEPEVQVFVPADDDAEADLATDGQDGEIPGLFPEERAAEALAAEPAPVPPAPATVPRAAAEPVEVPPMLAAILLWISLRFG